MLLRRHAAPTQDEVTKDHPLSCRFGSECGAVLVCGRSRLILDM